MEEDYSEYMLQPGDIPLGKKATKILAIKQASIVLLLFGCLLFFLPVDLFMQITLSGCGLLMIIGILGSSSNNMLVTTINGGQGMRAIYSEEIKEMFENLYEWDDDLFNEIMGRFGAVFGDMNLEQFTDLYKYDDMDEDDEHFNLEIEALFKAIDADNNGMVSLEDIKQGCSRGYENAYPHKFMTELEERKKKQVMAEYKASKSN